MEEIAKSVVDKITSYNIFNNFFPGIIFCYIVRHTTRFNFATGEIWEKLFIYYLIGMIISRIGSILIEKILKSIKVKNKETKKKEPFLKFEEYEDYVEASENSPFIKTLNESNNAYRTIISVFVMVIIVKLYDWLLYDLIDQSGAVGNNIVFIIVCILVTTIFVFSYRKQTTYISSRVNKYVSEKKNGK